MATFRKFQIKDFKLKILHANVFNLFNKRYSLFLLLVVLLSYRQLLSMYPWQDDHALMFKLANIEGAAGYLGAGLWGEGAYKYTAFFYYPLYLIFGYQIPVYFALSLTFYAAATLAVYKVFSIVLGRTAGRIAGLVFACGYIASDGFIRLYNSVGTSLSIIFISGLLSSYFLFFKRRNYLNYSLGLVFYFLAIEIIRYRAHYLIAIIVAFEIIFFAFRERLSGFAKSILRLAPFIFLFYRYFIVGADARSSRVKDWIIAILKGDYYQSFSFFTSVANIVLPDWFTGWVHTIFPRYGLLLILLIPISYFVIFRFRKESIVGLAAFSFVSLGWYLCSKIIFSAPALGLGEGQRFVAFLGGFLLIYLFCVFWKLKSEDRRISILLTIWFLVNIASYASYQPTVAYESANRFFAHSFFAFAGILGLLAVRKQKLQKFIFGFVLFYSIGNLVNSIKLQELIVSQRSKPAEKFYEDLVNYVPKLERGDLLYFDVAHESRQYFTDAFSVAQMPEETAIAWRYGIDRYDIRRFTDFNDLIQTIKDSNITDINDQKIAVNHLYTFYYADTGLVNTTEKTKKLLFQKVQEEPMGFTQDVRNGERVIEFDKPIESFTPLEIELTISATTQNSKDLDFPVTLDKDFLANSVAKEKSLRQLAFAYTKFKDEFRDSVKVESSSAWREDISDHLIDADPTTVWRPDRVMFGQENLPAIVVFDFGRELKIDRLIWINSFSSHTPTHFRLEVSSDQKRWTEIEVYQGSQRIDNLAPRVENFSPQKARYLKMAILASLDGDSPGISEMWVVPTQYSALNILDAEEFIAQPFGFVQDKKSFDATLEALNHRGTVKLYWQSDKAFDWSTTTSSQLFLIYDGRPRKYWLVLPAGGTKITKLKLSHFQIPGEIEINSATARHLTIDEL